MNPYSGVGFFEFFGILFERLSRFLVGDISPLAPDEIQLAVLACCAIGCGLIGPFLVLQRMAMFANSLSHTSLVGVVGAYLFTSVVWGSDWATPTTLMVGALLSALLTAGLIELGCRGLRLQEDASIGLVFTSLFAFGIALVSLYTRNAHISVEAVTGNPDALRVDDARLALGFACSAIVLVLMQFRPLMATAFDSSFARSVGMQTGRLRLVLFLSTAIAAICSFRAVGALVFLALLVAPYLTARLFCSRLSRLLVMTPLVGVTCMGIACALSRSLLTYTGIPLSTAGLAAAVLGGAFGVGALMKQLFTQVERSANIDPTMRGSHGS